MKRAQALRIGLPAVIATVGLVTAAVANRSSLEPTPGTSTSDSATNASPMASPSEAPVITVNGEPVKLDQQGKATLNSGGSRTTVQKSDDHTTVTTSGNGDVNVSVESNSTNSGSSSFSQSQVIQNSSSTGSNYSSSTVVSNGSDISQ